MFQALLLVVLLCAAAGCDQFEPAGPDVHCFGQSRVASAQSTGDTAVRVNCPRDVVND